MTDINLNELFGSSGEKLNAGEISRSKDTDNLINQLNDVTGILSDNDRTLNAFGFVEDTLTGGNNPDENSFFQNIARGVTSFADPELANVRSIREGMDSVFFEKVAEALEGQGQVSNFERQAGAASITNLKDKGISDEVALREANRLSEALSFQQWRSREKINIDENGFETQNGNNVITVRDQDGKIVTQPVDIPTIVVKSWMDPKDAKEIANRVGSNAQIYYKGKFFRRPQAQ